MAPLHLSVELSRSCLRRLLGRCFLSAEANRPQQIQRTSTFKGSDALAIVHGEKAEGSSASKAQALQLWLAGVELSDTVIVLTKQETTFFTSSKKGELIMFPVISVTF